MKDKKQIALWAIKEELDALKRIKAHYQRKSDADMIRLLILNEDKKILQENISVGYIKKAKDED